MSVVLVAASACLAALPPCRAVRPEAKPELLPNNSLEIFVHKTKKEKWYEDVGNRILCDICWRAADFRASAQQEGEKSPSAADVEKEVCNQYYAPSKLLSKEKERKSVKVDGREGICKKASEYAVYRSEEEEFVADRTSAACEVATRTTGKVLDVRMKCPEHLTKCGEKTSTRNSEAVGEWPQCLRAEENRDVPTVITEYVRSSVYPYPGPNNGLNDEWYDDVDNRILCDICRTADKIRASAEGEGASCKKYKAPGELLSKEWGHIYVGGAGPDAVVRCETASEYKVFREKGLFIAYRQADRPDACNAGPWTAGRKQEVREDCPGYLDQCETTPPQCSEEFFSSVYPYEARDKEDKEK